MRDSDAVFDVTTPADDDGHQSGSRLARLLGQTPLRFLPGLAVALCFVALEHHSGLTVGTVLLFIAAQTAAYAVPGMLTWRLVRGGRDPGIVDLVMGTIAFHALSVPWYIAVRWAGLPHLVWVLPIGAVVVALVVGRHRGLRLTSSRRLPWWCAWHGAVAISVGVTLMAPPIPATSGPLRRWVNTDNPFLLSLAGELKNHMPAVMPFVTGEKLDYHWFTFADIASTSWQGGQELDVLTFALVPLGLFALGLAGFGLLGWRFTGTAAGGVVALWLAVLVGSVNALGGFNGYVVDGTFFGTLWLDSVTQGYAEVLSIGLLFVLIDLLRARRRHPVTNWVLFVVLSFVISGAKSAFVPVLGAGALVALVIAVRRRRNWRTVGALGVVLAIELVFAQVVLFGGASQGLQYGPRAGLTRIAEWMGLQHAADRSLVLVLAFIVVGWLLPLLVVVVSLLRSERSRVRDDLASWWLIGMAVSAMIVVPLMTHPGLSQYCFLRAGLGFAYLGVAGSLLRLWALATPRVRCAAIVAALAGLGTCFALRAWSDPGGHVRTASNVAALLVVTLAVVLVVAVVAAVAARPGGRAVAVLLVAGSLTLGMGSARTVDAARLVDQPRPNPASFGTPVLPIGGIEAARYVRAHSDPDQLFATNAHFHVPGSPYNSATWMSAWTERRAVIEGWAYTATANASGTTLQQILTVPYWDPELLALNDRVFLHPSRRALDALLRRFRVKWLIVDVRFPADLPGLRALMPVNRTFGQTLILDVNSAP